MQTIIKFRKVTGKFVPVQGHVDIWGREGTV
jgi:hypothetical protein